MKIGYFGPKGTYTEKALYAFLDTTPFMSDVKPEDLVFETYIPTLFSKLEEGYFDTIVVPLENSTEGPVNDTFDALIHGQQATIIAENHLPIHHALMAKTALKFEDISALYSHPQPIAQCQHFIQTYFPNCAIIRTPTTAVAAELVTQSDKQDALIGDEGLAKKFNLTVLKTHIQDYENNLTRFITVGKTLCKPSGNDKSTFIFSAVKDQPGSLYNALGEFASRGINLTSIASRPAKTHLGDYLFWIELDGHVLESPVKEALDALKKNTASLKILGSYKKDPMYA